MYIIRPSSAFDDGFVQEIGKKLVVEWKRIAVEVHILYITFSLFLFL